MEKAELKEIKKIIETNQNERFVASMDLGTNSNRILVATSSGKTVYRDAQRVALGEGLAANGSFSSGAVERAELSFKNFSEVMNLFGVQKYRAIATAACRMNQNSGEFIRQIKDETGIKVEVISEYEEARLTLRGAKLNAPTDKKYLLVYDLGGGSTEITLATNDDELRILATISIPLGARNASEIFKLTDYNADGEEHLVQEVQKYLAEFKQKTVGIEYQNDVALIATSSTPLRLASWCLEYPKYDMCTADGQTVSIAKMDAVIDKVLQMTMSERTQSPYIGSSRADIFIAACIIFRTIYQALGTDEMIVSLKGALEANAAELAKEL